jgi:lysophospholipase L1-like esterase
MRSISFARRVLAHVALVVFGLSVALGIGELAARITWNPTPVPASAAARPTGDLPVLRTLAEFARPNVRGVMANGTSYRTNSRGVRGPDYAVPAPPSVFRIVVVGDSVTVGVNVEEEDAYPARLAALLVGRRGPQRPEVINLGMAGLNARQVMDRLEAIGLPYEPDLVIYGWTMNDIWGPEYRSFERPQGSGEQYRAVYERYSRSPSYLLRVLWPRWVSFNELFRPSPLSYVAELRHNYFDNPAAWDAFVAQLDRLAALAARRQACAVVFLHTSLTRLNIFHPLRAIYDRVADAARARGLTAVPSLAFFLGQDERALQVSVVDPHPNRAGHALLAAALVQGLDGLPERCWRPAGERRRP